MSSAQEAQGENINKIDVDTADPVDLKEPEANITTSIVSPLVNAAINEQQAINNNDSIISLDYLKMGGSSSTMMLKKDEPNSKDNMNLRFEIYRPLQPTQATVQEEIKSEVITTATATAMAMSSSQHYAIIEEPTVEILTAPAHVAIIEEPTIELISPATYCAIIEEPQMGTLKTFDGDEIIMLSDEIDDLESYQEPHKSIPDVFESADENNLNIKENDNDNDNNENDNNENDNNENDNNENDNNDNNNNSIEDECDGVILEAIDSNCCSCARRVRETETQTPRNRNATRQRARQQGPVSSSMGGGGGIVGTSSNYDSSEQLQQHKLKVNTQPQNTFKQRQLELHRHRIAVEQKRLELLELKIARERDEMIRERILFEKELDLKTVKIRKLTEDRFDL